jgi:hypothetical protein
LLELGANIALEEHGMNDQKAEDQDGGAAKYQPCLSHCVLHVAPLCCLYNTAGGRKRRKASESFLLAEGIEGAAVVGGPERGAETAWTAVESIRHRKGAGNNSPFEALQTRDKARLCGMLRPATPAA